jgi:N-acetylneuraminic acid mutarotase
VTDCERFNTSSGTWEAMASMNHPRHSHGICFHEISAPDGSNNKIPALFVVGGVGPEKEFVSMIEIYDLYNNTWTEVTLKNPIISPTSAGMFCQSINPNQILIFGGFKHLTFERGSAKSDSEDGVAKNKQPAKPAKLYDYPYPNSKIWIYNVAEESTRLLDSHYLSYGVFNDGNQIIADQRALYCIGKFNEKVAHIPSNQLLFSEDDNNKMVALKIDSADFTFKDFILLS